MLSLIIGVAVYVIFAIAFSDTLPVDWSNRKQATLGFILSIVFPLTIIVIFIVFIIDSSRNDSDE